MATTVNSSLSFDRKTKGIAAGLSNFFTVLSAAVAASTAVQNGRQPSPQTLADLGLTQESLPR